jgi:hypothetical protein
MVEDGPEANQSAVSKASSHYETAKARLGPRDRWAQLNPKDARLRRQLEKLTKPAIDRLSCLIKSDNEQVSLGAVRQVLDRSFGKAKQVISQDMSVVVTADAHVQALVALARMARAGSDAKLLTSTAIDLTATNSTNDINGLDGSAQHNTALDPGIQPCDALGQSVTNSSNANDINGLDSAGHAIQPATNSPPVRRAS